MTKSLIVGTFLVALTAAVSAHQSDIATISILASGHQTSLVASPQRYESGPAASVYLPAGLNVRLADELPVVGFQFTAWAEGGATRVAMFTLVPRRGAPDVDLRYRPDLVERRPFADYLLKEGETVSVEETRALGLEPTVLRARSRSEIFAELEKLDAALKIQQR